MLFPGMVPRRTLCAFWLTESFGPFDTSVIVELSMAPEFSRSVRVVILALLPFSLPLIVQAQGAKKTTPETPIADADDDHEEQRAEWFLRGRVTPGKSSAELRHRAYQAKMQARAVQLARARATQPGPQTPPSSTGWTPLGPVPLASDATGDGFQNYDQVSGRATAVAIDPADPTGNTVYIGGAQGGVWKSTNAATSIANNVAWTAVTDDQATLSLGSIVIQPGNSDPSQSVVLVGTGEADNSADSYFGLGMLRSADGGSTWSLISTANSGTYSFSGLGATRMAFSTAQTSTVVAAMAATSEGETDGALTGNTYRGLYTSTDAGQTWTYNALFSGASEATSATSVVYNTAAGSFFAAERYHGFYSSPDGLTWTRLANQPGAAGLLSTTNCPQNYVTSCLIYRGEITVVPGRNEMYVWFVSLTSTGDLEDQGIWQSKNGGASWTQISDSGIINCGDSNGCGVNQGSYNLELLAVPNGASATDLYAGAINLYKCSINSSNPTCSSAPFMNLTHVYGCSPLSALAHVHPDQHALAYAILSSGADLMYFANDGGIYRALNGFTGLTTGSCSGTNQFDDLNQNLGSMTQFVSFSQHATDANTLLGGTQDNGSPATATATTSSSWGNVLGGDGGYNAIDPNTGNWFTSNPDTGAGTLNIEKCASAPGCDDSSFNEVVGSSDVGGDDGSFYFPYILDPQSATTLLVGTCRVWSGPRSGGAFTVLSLNFDTLGTGTCNGAEVNTVRALAGGGPTNANGSQVIYATTDGLGPSFLSTLPVGGNVWVTTNATAVSGVSSTFKNVTLNGPGGSSINPNQVPISSVAIDTSDPTGNTAYVTVMGFTGGPGHVWQTTNAGTTWTDWTAFGGTVSLPDSPVNAVVVDPSAHTVYVGTDVGVFQSSTSAPGWTELGPTSSSQQSGFLPNVAVTALAIFNSGGQKLLRASTYGRGVWQFNLAAAPDFQIAVSNTPLTVFAGTTATFNGTVTAISGYDNLVEFSCTAGTSSPPSPCTPTPGNLTPTATGAAFSLTAGTGTVGDYNFNVQGTGSDPNNTTHVAVVALSVVTFGLTTPSPTTVTEPPGAASTPVSFQATAQGPFNQSVTLSCSFSPSISGASCAFTPGTVVNPTSTSPVNMTANVIVPVGTAAGNYTVTLQATTPGAPAPLTTSFTLAVTASQDFTVNSSTPGQTVAAGQTTGPYNLTIAPAGSSFAGVVTLSCSGIPSGAQCNFTPNPVVPESNSVNVVLTITTSGAAAGGTYTVMVMGTSGSISHSTSASLIVNNFQLQVSQPFLAGADAGSQQAAKVSLTPNYSGSFNTTCDATVFSGQCSVTPGNPIPIAAGTATTLTLTVNIPNTAAPQPTNAYNINLTVTDLSGQPTQTLPLPLTVIQDFTVGSLTPSATQTITAGQSVRYNFSVLPVGSSFANAVTLSCSGAPAISLCSFSPNPVTPGASSAAVVVTISTTSSSASLFPQRPDRTVFSSSYALWLALPALALLGNRGRRRKHAKLTLRASLLGLFLLAFLLPSCGGGGSNGGDGGSGGQQQGTKPGTYTINVTGASGTLSHAAPSTVTLVVNQ